MDTRIKTFAVRATLLAALCAAGVSQAATITIQSRDPAGVGFNDPTPRRPGRRQPRHHAG